jgi:O-antigen ligase
MMSGITVAEDRLTSGGGYDPNDLAALLAFTAPLAAGIALRERGKQRLAALATLPLLALIIAKTASRGGVLALVVGMGVFILGQRGKRRVMLIVLAIIAAAGMWSFGPPVFRARLLSMTELQNDYNFSAYTGRKAVWSRARGYFLEHPITGVGYENFPVAEGETWERIGMAGKWSAAHNSYLQAFAELGMIGGCLFLALLLSAGRRAYALWKRSARRAALGIPDRPEMLAALMAFCTSAYFLSHAYLWALFTLLGLIFMSERVTRAEFAAAGYTPEPTAARRRPGGQR